MKYGELPLQIAVINSWSYFEETLVKFTLRRSGLVWSDLIWVELPWRIWFPDQTTTMQNDETVVLAASTVFSRALPPKTKQQLTAASRGLGGTRGG